MFTREMQVESAIIAEEIKQHNPQLHGDLVTLLESLQQLQGNTISTRYVSHEQFQQRTQSSQAVILSGECSPYENVITWCGRDLINAVKQPLLQLKEWH